MNINVNKKIDKLLKSPLLSSGIFITTGAYKTYSDYKNSDEKYKKHFLLKDTIVLTGAAVGLLGHKVATAGVSKNKYYNQITEYFAKKITPLTNKKSFNKAISNTKEIIGNTFFNFTMFASGIAGALGMDYLLSLTGFEQPVLTKQNGDTNVKLIHNEKINDYIEDVDSNVNKIVNKKTQKAIYDRVADMPQMQILASTVIGTQALELSKEKESHNRLKHTTKCLISNSLVPLLFLSTASTFTKNIKPIIRIPLVFTTLVVGTTFTNKMINNYISKKDL